MNERAINIGVRVILHFLLQILVMKRIDLTIGEFNYIHILTYPMAILLFPLNTPRAIILIIAFIMGIGLDSFYNSPGVHAGALTFTAYFRSFIFSILEPYEGYSTDLSPTLSKMGFPWFLSYLSIAFFSHCFVYFSLESFSFVFIFTILLNTVFSFIFSLLIVLIIHFIFKPKF
jgi:rod shape-determining protein MreD